MKKLSLIKIAIVALVLAFCFWGFTSRPTAEIQTLDSTKMPEKIVNDADEVAGYKNWTKVNDKPQLMDSITAILCVFPPPQKMLELDAKDPHKRKFVNVYVNDLGKDEMLTKKNPKFPVGTIIVKEKFSSPESKNPELLTVMIKRQRDFNPKVGDWEFLTLNGAATEVTSKGKLQSCQACHIEYKENDYISRKYLPYERRKNLK